MKTGLSTDRLSGTVFIVIGAIVVLSSWSLPYSPGLNAGPGTFPLFTGTSLMLAGGILLARTFLARSAADLEPAEAGEAPIPVLRAAGIVGALVFTAVALKTLGFLVTITLFMAAAMLLHGVRGRGLVFAPLISGLIYVFFSMIMKVDLPRMSLGIL